MAGTCVQPCTTIDFSNSPAALVSSNSPKEVMFKIKYTIPDGVTHINANWVNIIFKCASSSSSITSTVTSDVVYEIMQNQPQTYP